MNHRVLRAFIVVIATFTVADSQTNERTKKGAAQIQAQEAIEKGVQVFYGPANKSLVMISQYGTNDTNTSAIVEEVMKLWKSGDCWGALLKASTEMSRKYPVYSGIVAFALAFCIILPVAFLFWCSARYCCKRCHYELENEMDSRHAGTKRCCCSALLLLIVVTMSACVVLGFLATVTLNERISAGATEQSTQRSGTVVATTTRSVSSSSSGRQAVGTSTIGVKSTIFGSLDSALASCDSFIQSLLQNLNSAEVLVESALQRVVNSVLRRVADELLVLVEPLSSATEAAQQLGKQLAVVQLDRVRLVRNFLNSTSTTIDVLYTQSNCSYTVDLTMCSKLREANSTLSALLPALPKLRSFEDRAAADVFSSALVQYRQRIATHSQLNNSWIRSQLESEFRTVSSGLQEAVASLHRVLDVNLRNLTALTDSVRKQLAPPTSSGTISGQSELGRRIVTFTILGLAAFVCFLLYMALGFGVWGQRARPLERDEYDEREMESCCNRPRAASNAAAGACCLFPVGACVMLIALVYLTAAFFVHTELCVLHPSVRSSCVSGAPTSSFLDAIMNYLAMPSPVLPLQVPGLALNVTVPLSTTALLRGCASDSQRAFLDAAAPRLRCELETALNSWLANFMRKLQSRGEQDLTINAALDNITATFQPAEFASLLEVLESVKGNVGVLGKLQDLVAQVANSESAQREPTKTNVKSLNATLDAFATPPNNVTDALKKLAELDVAALNSTWQLQVLRPLKSFKKPSIKDLFTALAQPNVTLQLAELVTNDLVASFGTCEHLTAGWKHLQEATCTLTLPPLNALWFALGVLALLVIPAICISLKLNQLWRKRYPYDEDNGQGRHNAPLRSKKGYRRVSNGHRRA